MRSHSIAADLISNKTLLSYEIPDSNQAFPDRSRLHACWGQIAFSCEALEAAQYKIQGNLLPRLQWKERIGTLGTRLCKASDVTFVCGKYYV